MSYKYLSATGSSVNGLGYTVLFGLQHVLKNGDFSNVRIKALPEGTRCPLNVPMVTFEGDREVGEAVCRALWQSITNATQADWLKSTLEKWAKVTGVCKEFVANQVIDNSFGALSSLESGIVASMAHLTAFNYGNSLGVAGVEKYYGGVGYSFAEYVNFGTVKTILGDFKAVEGSDEWWGLVRVLDRELGSTVNAKGFKVLNDETVFCNNIDNDTASLICSGLATLGYASCNCLFGVVDMYQNITQKTFNLKVVESSLVRVGEWDGEIALFENQTRELAEGGMLEDVFVDGKLVRETTLNAIRERLV